MNRLLAFPDDARVWVFPLAETLDPGARALVTQRLDAFLQGWNSHGTPVHGAYGIVEDRFVLIAGFVDDGVSGCSTDSMVRVMKDLRSDHRIDGFDRSLVFFRDADGNVKSASRADFQAQVASGAISDDTIVFDPTVQTVRDLRDGRFETTFARSWHAGAFR